MRNVSCFFEYGQKKATVIKQRPFNLKLLVTRFNQGQITF